MSRTYSTVENQEFNSRGFGCLCVFVSCFMAATRNMLKSLFYSPSHVITWAIKLLLESSDIKQHCRMQFWLTSCHSEPENKSILGGQWDTAHRV